MSSDATKFSIDEHINYRKSRLSQVDIQNPKLLGLAAVEINPTELCNRTCSFCPRHDPNIYPNRNLHMSLETVCILVEQLKQANYSGEINITGFGEPLLNKQIVDIIQICSQEFYTSVITNGDRIQVNQNLLKELQNTSLDLLMVDCYDNAEQTKWFENILPKYKVPFTIRNHYDTGDVDFQSYGYNNRGGALYKNNEKQNRVCYLPSYKMFVDWNGDVLLCCNDWFRKTKRFGNIHICDVSKIWNCEYFVNHRTDLIAGKRSCYAACKFCDVDGTKYGIESAKLWNT